MTPIALNNNRTLDSAATNSRVSTVGEPSAGAAGQQVFMTGNWYASSSTDAGASWTHVDPFDGLGPAPTRFCCDQVVVFDAERRIWIWLLQYAMAPDGSNVFRIAFTPEADFPGGWRFWQLGPGNLDAGWKNLWFDYPDAALSADNLHVSFNLFNAQKQWQRAVVMRFPLATIAAGGTLTAEHWDTTETGSVRLTQGAAGTMYWAGHISPAQVRLFSWDDGQAAINSWNVAVRKSNRQISSVAPNGVDWLARADGRITGAAVAGGVVTLMWTGGSDANHPHPFCRVVRINEVDKTLIDEPDIWSSTRAWAYPAAAPNGNGDIGFTAFYGGGDQHPSHVVGVRTAGGAWESVFAQNGGDSPAEAKWGDYLTCRANAPTDDTWLATGYTLEGGQTLASVVPRFVQFGIV